MVFHKLLQFPQKGNVNSFIKDERPVYIHCPSDTGVMCYQGMDVVIKHSSNEEVDHPWCCLGFMLWTLLRNNFIQGDGPISSELDVLHEGQDWVDAEPQQ